MESKQFLSDDLNHSPYPDQGFLADRFSKKSSHLNIPDTIPENSSAELSGDSLKMEAHEVAIGDFSHGNISVNEKVQYNESLNKSVNVLVDNSYLKHCERRVLENSSSDSEKNIKSDRIIVKNEQILIPRKLEFPNDSISTPPSLLRKEISLLRSEMAEAHEFHDFEIQVLKEEKLSEVDSQNYLELIEKYSSLMELYTGLKTEYDEYRKEQEKMRQELHSKTADCLESLCSQIEASDNSLNFSNASFVSFNGGIRSSTMMEDISEVEATVVHDATVLANDPLSITCDGVFKTPMQTPLKSTKKLFPQELDSTVGKPIVKEVQEIISKRETTIPLDSEYNIQLLNLEAALFEKVREVEDLEHRLFKVEDLSSVLQNEFERITSVYAKENNALKESLGKKSEQLSEVTQKLFTEIISLNPSLRDSLTDVSGLKLLIIFIETIMESCKKIQSEEIAKHNAEKAQWEANRKLELTMVESLQNQVSSQLVELVDLRKKCESLERKLSDAESTVLTRNEEILTLQSRISALEETRDFTSTGEALSELESRLTLTEAEKMAAENRCRELESVVENLKEEICVSKKLQVELQGQLLSAEEKKLEIENDNIRLKQSHDSLKVQIAEVEGALKLKALEVSELIEKLAAVDNISLELKSQLHTVQTEKLELESRCNELEENNRNLRVEITNAINLENNLEYEKIQFENDDLKQRICESEKIIAEVKAELELAKEGQQHNFCKVEELIKEIEQLKKENSVFSKALDTVEESQKNLADVLLDLKNDNELPSDRIIKLIENSKNIQEHIETRETKIISVFVETITKTCNGVQNELIKQFDNKKLEWESQRSADLNLITNLQDQIKLLHEKNVQHEAQISKMSVEKEDLVKSHEDHKEELEKNISTYNVTLKQMMNDLAAAYENIAKLKSQLESVLSEDKDMKDRCRKLEEIVVSLQSEVELKEIILKDLNELKITREKFANENEELKQQVFNSEEVIAQLKESLEKAKEEQSAGEVRVMVLQSEIDLLKKEHEDLVSLSEKLETLEKNNKNIMDLLSDIQLHLDLPESTLTDLLSGNFENKKIFSERINSIIKNQMENQISWQETKNFELEELKKVKDNLEEKLSSAEKTILTREEEILTLQSDLRQIREDFTAVKKCVSDLEFQLALSESEKKDIKGRSLELEKVIESLKEEIDTKEMLRAELQTHLLSVEEQRSKLESDNMRLEELRDSLEAKIAEAEVVISKREEEICAQEVKLVELDDLKKLQHVLEEKLSDAENTVSDQEKKIQMLQSDVSNMKRNQADFNASKEVLSERLMSTEIEKTKIEKRCHELEENINEFKTKKSEIETENIKLKESYDALKAQMAEAENNIFTRDEEIRALNSYKSELTAIKENLKSAEETISQLKSQLKSIEVEKSEMENCCRELKERNQDLRVEITSAKNLENNPAYEKIQTENGDLKEKILESEKMMTELKNELELAKVDQMNNICRVKELIREIEELKKENTGFSQVLITIEETQKNLADVLSDVRDDSDLPSDRITKLIAQNSKLPDSVDTRETKIVSDFVETITKTCKGVQNELIKKFDNKKLEWENQKDVDLQNLQSQIETLARKNIEHEAIIKQTKDDLAAANEAILQLKSELSLVQTEKVEVEIRCSKLERDTLSLQAEIDTKETIIKGLGELKIVREKFENENSELKQQVLQGEEIITRLKKGLDVIKEEQITKEMKMQDLQNEINFLTAEQESVTSLSKKLENLEKTNKSLLEVVSDIHSHLNMPEDILTKLLSGSFKNTKIFREKINSFAKTQMEELKIENRNLKLGVDNMKEKVKQLTQLIGETASKEQKEDFSYRSSSHSNSVSLRSKSNKSIDLCVRRLDRLEDINHNLTELLTKVLTSTEFPDVDKIKLCSLRDFPDAAKKVLAHIKGLEVRMKELKEENAQLDEECETYANIIKDLKKEAAVVWRTNKEKTEALEEEINRLKGEKNRLEEEKQDLMAKISKLESECQKLKSASKNEGPVNSCACGNESKKINELKRIILVKEQKLLELQDLETQSTSYKTQIEYLKSALDREKKKVLEEKEKNKKLQTELDGTSKNQKIDKKEADENQILNELRMRGSISGGIVQEFVDKEKMRKLSKDIGILKELCRARYAEIKRLEAVNAALKNGTPKNSNQMDSPIRSTGYNTRSKNTARDLWRTEIGGKENSFL